VGRRRRKETVLRERAPEQMGSGSLDSVLDILTKLLYVLKEQRGKLSVKVHGEQNH
jgi:hypothetical protein